MVFELVTGELLFDPRSGRDYERCCACVERLQRLAGFSLLELVTGELLFDPWSGRDHERCGARAGVLDVRERHVGFSLLPASYCLIQAPAGSKKGAVQGPRVWSLGCYGLGF